MKTRWHTVSANLKFPSKICQLKKVLYHPVQGLATAVTDLQHTIPRPSHRCSAQQTVGVGAGADVAADVEGPVTLVREMEGPATSPVEHSKVGHCSGMYPGGGAARLIHPALVACPAPTRKGGREVRVDPGGV